MARFIVEKRKPFDRMSKNNDGTVEHITGTQTDRAVIEADNIVFAERYAIINYPHLYKWQGQEYTVIFEDK